MGIKVVIEKTAAGRKFILVRGDTQHGATIQPGLQLKVMNGT